MMPDSPFTRNLSSRMGFSETTTTLGNMRANGLLTLAASPSDKLLDVVE
jgi:hypothetical protein